MADDDPRRVGEYRLSHRLGKDGTGCVYLGRAPDGRIVAVKVVYAEIADVPGFRERFAREVRASRAVSGPGLVPVPAADRDARVPWLASAYVPGPSLPRPCTSTDREAAVTPYQDDVRFRWPD
ncbi:hypothetical protein [Streptomyces cavernae]|uniref:hypothetical protein n=1 Tax=Streptomyces cavernae TaxID=2259034 RepID=UPI000FEBA151|nr:hypothetical protein [Streptomyces cavernae]